MGTVPVPRTWVDGEIPPYNVMTSEVYDVVSFLLQPPMIKVRQTTSQSIPSGLLTAITFQQEDYDPYNWHSSANTSRFYPNFPGWYRGWYSVGFSGSTAGTNRTGYVQRSGSQGRSRRDGKVPTGSTNKRFAGVPFFFAMDGVSDYLEVFALQDSGSAMSLPVTNNLNAEFFCRWWGPL